jgi:hypothetical protein
VKTVNEVIRALQAIVEVTPECGDLLLVAVHDGDYFPIPHVLAPAVYLRGWEQPFVLLHAGQPLYVPPADRLEVLPR